jgi:hypothetical protein
MSSAIKQTSPITRLFWKNGKKIEITASNISPEVKQEMQKINGGELNLMHKSVQHANDEIKAAQLKQDPITKAGQLGKPRETPQENLTSREFLESVEKIYDEGAIRTMSDSPKINQMINDANIYREDT